MGSMEAGAKQAVENCVRIKEGEKVVIITDRETSKVACAIEKAARGITSEIYFFVMESFGSRPLDFPDGIGDILAEADASYYVAQGVPGELATFRQPMLKIVDESKKLRHAHMIGITQEIMEDGMCSDYSEIQRVSRLVYGKVKGASEIVVVTPEGTDLTVRFNPALRWKVSDGDIKPDDWSNLPDGEVFTCPHTVNGQIVIDGCLGDYFTKKYGSLEETPLSVEISGGRARKESVVCRNKAIKNEFMKYVFETDENSDRIGEFAIGTNVGLTKLIGNLLQDEKFPGVHIAFGSPFPNKTGADWDSKGHLDGVIKNPFVFADREMIMEHGRFLLG